MDPKVVRATHIPGVLPPFPGELFPARTRGTELAPELAEFRPGGCVFTTVLLGAWIIAGLRVGPTVPACLHQSSLSLICTIQEEERLDPGLVSAAPVGLHLQCSLKPGEGGARPIPAHGSAALIQERPSEPALRYVPELFRPAPPGPGPRIGEKMEGRCRPEFHRLGEAPILDEDLQLLNIRDDAARSQLNRILDREDIVSQVLAYGPEGLPQGATGSPGRAIRPEEQGQFIPGNAVGVMDQVDQECQGLTTWQGRSLLIRSLVVRSCQEVDPDWLV